MNIQRYTWPVIIAVSLHGVLFLGAPRPPFVDIKTPHVQDGPLPPLLKDLIEITPPEPDSGAEASPASGGPAALELPEILTVALDKEVFIQPVVDQIRPETFTKSLKEWRGPGGPEIGPGPSIGSSIIPVGQLDRHPRATAQMSPDYPSSMHQQGISGSVTVEFDVDRQGRVVRAEAIRYTRREFAEPALRAVRSWHFEPGKRNGATVPFRMTVPIEFSFNAT